MFFLVASIISLSPMMLILPVKILKSCGNSSMLIFRIHRPHLSMYRSGFSSICVGMSCGVDIFMLRNLSKPNCVLCIPILFCLKNTGPGSSPLTINAKTIIGKARTTIPIKENTISINRFKKSLYIFAETNFQKIIFHEKNPKSTAEAASRTCRMQLPALQHFKQICYCRVDKRRKYPAFAVTIHRPKLICTYSYSLFYYTIRQSVCQFFF